MRCPKCGMQIQPNHQEIYETKTKITRYYDCRYCRHKFRTVEKIVEEADVTNIESLASWNEAGVIHIKLKKKKMED